MGDIANRTIADRFIETFNDRAEEVLHVEGAETQGLGWDSIFNVVRYYIGFEDREFGSDSIFNPNDNPKDAAWSVGHELELDKADVLKTLKEKVYK
jgi:hypothetical protein